MGRTSRHIWAEVPSFGTRRRPTEHRNRQGCCGHTKLATSFPGTRLLDRSRCRRFPRIHDFRGDELVYCDPPYLPSTRRRARLYRHDYSESDHVRLLEMLQKVPCRVVLSGYPSELYAERLRDWNSRTYSAKAHDGFERRNSGSTSKLRLGYTIRHTLELTSVSVQRSGVVCNGSRSASRHSRLRSRLSLGVD